MTASQKIELAEVVHVKHSTLRFYLGDSPSRCRTS